MANDDLVLREVTILIRDCNRMSETLGHLRHALRNDSRFATVAPPNTGALSKEAMSEPVKQTGPEDLTDPFSVPLGGSYD